MRLTYNWRESWLGSAEGARNLSLETVCEGRRSFFIPAGNGKRVNRIGICVSTRVLRGVRWTVRVVCEFEVFIGAWPGGRPK
jgi:hypothetical protein